MDDLNDAQVSQAPSAPIAPSTNAQAPSVAAEASPAPQAVEKAPSWFSQHAVEVIIVIAAILVSAAIGWAWHPSNRATPQGADVGTSSSVTAPASSNPQAASLAGVGAAVTGAWQVPVAPRTGDVAQINTGKISADILQGVLKNPKWAPVVGPIGKYVGQAMQAEAAKLSSKGWVVLSSNAVLAVPAGHDFTEPVEQEIVASLQSQLPAMLAQSTQSAGQANPAAQLLPSPTAAAIAPAGQATAPAGGSFQP
jgi:hypothetical protein